MRDTARLIALLATALLSTPGPTAAGLLAFEQIPIFAHVVADDASLAAFRVPVHADITVQKVLKFHVRLDGYMQYDRPNHVVLTLPRIPDQQRQFFAKLASPQAWVPNFDLQVTGTRTVAGLTHYAIRGVPKGPNEGVDELVADVSSDPSPTMKATWFLTGGGTIDMRTETAMIGGYVLPVRQNADIRLPGYRLHADLSYGDYTLERSPAKP